LLISNEEKILSNIVMTIETLDFSRINIHDLTQIFKGLD